MKFFIISLLIMAGLTVTNPSLSDGLRQKKTITPLTEVELAETLQTTYKIIFNSTISDLTLAHAWAQVAFENSRGKKIYNNNLGNIGAGKSEKYYRVAGSRFKHFDSSSDGAKAYWTHLKKICQMTLKYFGTGHTRLAVNHLEKCGYYRIDAERYFINMNSLKNEAIKKILPELKNQLSSK